MICSDGLFYYNAVSKIKDATNSNNSSVNIYPTSNSRFSFLTTVESNTQLYTKREVNKADEAMHMQHVMAWPGTQNYKTAIKNNLVKNYPIAVGDVDRASDIYGEPTPILQGKMVRKTPEVIRSERVSLPDEIRKRHSNTNLSVEILYVNGIPFLLCKSCGIKYLHVTKLRSRGKKEIRRKLKFIKI